MKILSWCFLPCLSVGLFLAPLAATADEAAPKVGLDTPPSASLQPFLDTHLDKILVPLGESAFTQSEVITSLKAAYADGKAAAPDARKPAFQAAQDVCDALTGAITERENAATALQGALVTRTSEAAQPRGSNEARERARNTDTFFADGQRNNWMRRATALRENINALYLRERADERQVGVWAPPAAIVAVANTNPAPDPVVGKWLLEGRSSLMLEADNTVTGDRHGGWLYTCDTSGGRNYGGALETAEGLGGLPRALQRRQAAGRPYPARSAHHVLPALKREAVEARGWMIGG